MPDSRSTNVPEIPKLCGTDINSKCSVKIWHMRQIKTGEIKTYWESLGKNWSKTHFFIFFLKPLTGDPEVLLPSRLNVEIIASIFSFVFYNLKCQGARRLEKLENGEIWIKWLLYCSDGLGLIKWQQNGQVPRITSGKRKQHVVLHLYSNVYT